jgi:DNA-binding NarL/FixJ family response regulator
MPGTRVSPEVASAPPCQDDGVAATLLIVDDHDGFRRFARELLEAGGYVVVGEAADGASAIEAVVALDPEVVLLDVALPDMDGFLVCERLTERNASRPVVVLTSSRDASSFRRRLASSAARGFIAKSDLTGPVLDAMTC